MTQKTYSIKADSSQFVLVESYVQEKGKDAGLPKDTNIGYYSTLEALVRAVHTKMLFAHGLDNLVEAFAAANKVVDQAVAITSAPQKEALAKLASASEGK
jgi:hypothetical protein